MAVLCAAECMICGESKIHVESLRKLFQAFFLHSCAMGHITSVCLIAE
jgi:hypothetical protein